MHVLLSSANHKQKVSVTLVIYLYPIVSFIYLHFMFTNYMLKSLIYFQNICFLTMGRPKSSEIKVYDSKLTKDNDEEFKCVSSGHILSSIKANNFLSHARTKLKKLNQTNRPNNLQSLIHSKSYQMLTETFNKLQLLLQKLLFQLTFFDLTKPETF